MADEEEDKQTDAQIDAQADADLDAGYGDEKTGAKGVKEAPKAEESPKPEPEAKGNGADPAPEPEHVQLTKEQYEHLELAAKKVLSLENQLRKTFGYEGNVQKLQKQVNEFLATQSRGPKVEIPKEFETDFPELAKHIRNALEASLRGTAGFAPPTAESEPGQLDKLVKEFEERTFRAELKDLDDQFPTWQEIVGRVDVASGQVPDPNNAFRKWLDAQTAEYQAEINATESPADIRRAIRRFQQETKPPPVKPPAPNLQQQLRQARIADAIKPRGDGGAAPPSRTDEDEFERGFAQG